MGARVLGGGLIGSSLPDQVDQRPFSQSPYRSPQAQAQASSVNQLNGAQAARLDSLNQATMGALQGWQNSQVSGGSQLANVYEYAPPVTYVSGGYPWSQDQYYRSMVYGAPQPGPTPEPEEPCMTPIAAIAANGKRQIEV